MLRRNMDAIALEMLLAAGYKDEPDQWLREEYERERQRRVVRTCSDKA